jgi:hypothetical protein
MKKVIFGWLIALSIAVLGQPIAFADSKVSEDQLSQEEIQIADALATITELSEAGAKKAKCQIFVDQNENGEHDEQEPTGGWISSWSKGYKKAACLDTGCLATGKCCKEYRDGPWYFKVFSCRCTGEDQGGAEAE